VGISLPLADYFSHSTHPFLLSARYRFSKSPPSLWNTNNNNNNNLQANNVPAENVLLFYVAGISGYARASCLSTCKCYTITSHPPSPTLLHSHRLCILALAPPKTIVIGLKKYNIAEWVQPVTALTWAVCLSACLPACLSVCLCLCLSISPKTMCERGLAMWDKTFISHHVFAWRVIYTNIYWYDHADVSTRERGAYHQLSQCSKG